MANTLIFFAFIAKATQFFCSKNTSVFENTLATTVNQFVIYELVKLTMFCITGPWKARLFTILPLTFKQVYLTTWWPALVAQLDACPTGDQEVAGSTPAEVGNILLWRLIMKYFQRSFSPFCRFKKGSCQFLAKECAQSLRGLSPPSKRVVR